MKAIVVSRSGISRVGTRTPQAAERRSGIRPSPLLPLVDRPFVEHLVEQLAAQGVRQIFFRLRPHEIPAFGCVLGKGERWGVTLHLSELTQPVRLGLSNADERILVGPYDTLPLFPEAANSMRNSFPQNVGRMFYLHPKVERDQTLAATRPEPWTGWVELPLTLGADLTATVESIAGNQNLDELACHATPEFVSGILSVTDLSWLLASQRNVLNGPFRNRIFVYGRERKAGVRICRNVRIHRTASLTGPVFIGDNVRIGKRVILGPNCVIGANCIVDNDAHLSDAQILPRTYVGQRVEAHKCVVQHRQVANIRLNAQLQIDDALVVSKI